MGDVNHGNCVVLADGTVRLIDCDSYAVKTDKTRYRCEVGVATHLAPELHGLDLGSVEREADHDNFGLAVIIFQLLFLGRHPFAGNYLGAEDKSLEDCISEYRFAYGETAEMKRVKQPPGTLSLAQVSPRIASLFERSFTDGETRPEPREWVEALEDLSENLEQCSFHPGHHYFNKLVNCPWCEIEAQTGVMLFPFISAARSASGERSFNIFTIESLIANISTWESLPVKPVVSNILKPPPVPGITALKRKSHSRQMLVVGVYFFTLLFSMAIFGVGASCVFGFMLVAFFTIVLNSLDRNLVNDLKERLKEAEQEWETFEREWAKAASPKKLTEDLSQIRYKINEYQDFQRESVRLLKSSGAEDGFIQKTVQKRSDIEREIERLLASLRSGSVYLNRQRQQLAARSEEIAADLLQARSNAESYGTNSLAIIVLFLITFLTPMVGILFREAVSPRVVITPPTSSDSYRRSSGTSYGTRAEPIPDPPVRKSEADDLYVPDESITGQEIEEMYKSEREKYADILRRQALSSKVNRGDIKNAERKLRFALRFNEIDQLVLNELASTLYEQKKYSESLQYLNRLQILDPTNAGTNIFIGINYLQLKQYADARDILEMAVRKYPDSGEGFYNLGLAYKGLKDYKRAEKAFRDAIELNTANAEARYELGYCLYKQGDITGALEEYEELNNIDENIAERLRRDAKL